MAPKKREDERSLSGQFVVAPKSLWPGFPVPKGAAGFEGKVGKRKDSKHHFVTFPDDASKYFFPDVEIRKWLVTGGSSGGQPAAKQKHKEGPAATAAAAAAVAAPASKRKDAPSSAAAARAPAEQLSKKAKAAAAAPASSPRKAPKSPAKSAAAPAEVVSKDELRVAIDAALDLLDVQSLQKVHKAILDVNSDNL
ncbi:hypothetical protein D9Q98_010075 [Chlorella vulgaris]|uniref:Uncharacterized protein n=1 Tax=Chlorella vulgaris TaxID=3077 RepID=A0A9D4TMS7_CHLVU|nr:hypothetical protein D9Q98_010075 [Chlorella vulgaris]